MTFERFGFGERVRHPKRPEWGVGSIMRAEDVVEGGAPSQRLSIRFPGVGVKTINTAHAALERVSAGADAADVPADKATAVQIWDKMSKNEWIAPVAERKLEEAMVAISDDIRDPFVSARERLERAVTLYRFDQSGRGLVEWAVAQTGMDDPLSRFNRHELEQFFDRWAGERDAYLSRLWHEAPEVREHLTAILAAVSPAARRAVQRITGAR